MRSSLLTKSKFAARDFALWEEERALTFWRLDCHADNDRTGKIEKPGHGTTQKLVERYRCGEKVDVRQGQKPVGDWFAPRGEK